MGKNPPAVQETWVRSLGQEDPLEEGMTNHSSVLSLENSMDREATVSLSKELDSYGTNTLNHRWI